MIAKAPTGFPALRKLFRDDFPPLLRAADPFLRNLNPILTGLNLYKHEITSLVRQRRRGQPTANSRPKTRRRKPALPAGDGPARTRNP